MTEISFATLKTDSKFVALNSGRDAILCTIEDLLKALKSWSRDKPSFRRFSNLEDNVKQEIKNLKASDSKIATWLKSLGGDVRQDEDFLSYKVEATELCETA